ncbi:hypothetical protein ACUOFC_63820, partial [Escherichia sp. TWPC-MK]
KSSSNDAVSTGVCGARYGYDVKPDMTPREQRRVIMAFQMHFRPTLYNGEADAETQAMGKLLEKMGAEFVPADLTELVSSQ